jgi:hypothetical protein
MIDGSNWLNTLSTSNNAVMVLPLLTFGSLFSNVSSGSTMTALLDVDNVFNQFEPSIMEVNEELVNELYGEIINYQHKLIGNLRVERGIDLY